MCRFLQLSRADSALIRKKKRLLKFTADVRLYFCG